MDGSRKAGRMAEAVRRVFRPSWSLAIVILALAAGGTAVAHGVITSADVKNGTLTLKDFKKSERAKLRGPRGPRGQRGATGLRGLQGPGALRIAYSAPETAGPQSFSIGGLTIAADCGDSAPGTFMSVTATSNVVGGIDWTYVKDAGPAGGEFSDNDGATMGPGAPVNLMEDLNASPSGLERQIQNVIYNNADSVVSLELVATVNADTSACSLYGTATPAS